ncbi:unnamed protein product [Acanthoscelides obtectus]|uniref:Uncharacterized protein n=1 Tax=Acanthoscelides obtectus TaxID=200917 RepID=A0A9P0KBV0_ACAOB|nr:unnamed protein product [Acanthoscelides obtectus]CAK1646801.1 Equilibrative nucleoside transporter 3 [Acanthoscelides obtectus]
MDHYVEKVTASYTSLNQQDPTQNKKYVVEEPRDRFFLVHFLFLLFGLLHLMPLTFLITANNYWMHKFRNVSMEHQDVEYRSPLQRYFTAGTAVAEAVPTIVCTLLATAYGHKFLVRSRIFVTLSVIAACYVLCTIFVKINVNSWQTGFYALTMATLATIQTMLAVYQVTSLVLLAKFPGNYMKFFLFGEGVAGIFTSSLQVVCLAIGGEPETSALIYFCTGTFLLILTLVIFKVVKYLDIYDYYVTLNKEDTKRKTHSFTEAMKVAREIWPCLVIFMTYVATLAATHPSVTSLVISENAGKGYTWNDKYFVPVITFLFSDVCSLCGRLCATGFLTILGVAILSSCNNVKEKLKEMSLTAFQMLTFLPLKRPSLLEEEVYDDILAFEQMVLKRVDFKIAGFFVLDKPVIFAMLGSVTSYVIICFGLDKNFRSFTQAKGNGTIVLTY